MNNLLTDPANHPTNSPLTGERITRLIAELQHSLSYQNGGDMAYVIADAIKGLEELLVSREAVLVAWTEKCEITNMQATGLYLRGFPNNSQGRDIPLYTAPPSLVVADGWIPVSERMPTQGDYVSAVSRHGEYVSGLVNDEWLELHDGTSFGIDEVYLWMPTPPLPEEPREVK